VQLLSRKLHAQLFKNVSCPPPDPSFVRIACEHLEMHGIDRTKGSVLPDTSFVLPPLRGSNLSEHFHSIGSSAASPWLDLAKDFASSVLPPRPDDFETRSSGWTKYYYHSDGSSYWKHVPYPEHDGKPEEMLTFDVETMPPYHPHAIMACAASKTAWYSWISPWLLGESSEMQHLIPLGDPSCPRVVVGHNVSYDRARVKEEYSLNSTKTRFLDTMALHVAVKGISSHQRPAWMKYRKSKEKAQERKDETIGAVVGMIEDVEARHDNEPDVNNRETLRRLRQEMEDGLPLLQAEGSEAAEAEMDSQRWEAITSANSLADVAKLHCGIQVDKEVRNDFMTLTPSEIRRHVHAYLSYCANDVFVTHAVFAQALPAFLSRCPNPVTFAGILTMGSSFLTVDEGWVKYLEDAERTYQQLDKKVKKRLVDLAEEAKGMMTDESWKDDVWLSQLDWTPKSAGTSRGIASPEVGTVDS
jgi:DNA polymerase gamma 1